MTMDSKATEKISFNNSEELNQKWAEETSKVKIAKEACIRVAITEDGEVRGSMENMDKELFLGTMAILDESNHAAFSSAAASIAAANLVKGFSGFLNDLAKASDDDSEEADGDDDEDDSDSEDGEGDNTPEY